MRLKDEFAWGEGSSKRFGRMKERGQLSLVAHPACSKHKHTHGRLDTSSVNIIPGNA